MYRRKIESFLLDWKNTPNHKPLVIKGCRQCGKTCAYAFFFVPLQPNPTLAEINNV